MTKLIPYKPHAVRAKMPIQEGGLSSKHRTIDLKIGKAAITLSPEGEISFGNDLASFFLKPDGSILINGKVLTARTEEAIQLRSNTIKLN